MSGQQRSLRAPRIAVSLMFFANGTVLASWAARIPAIQQHLQLDAGALGIALWGLAVGALAAFPLTGWLIARLGSRHTTTGAALVCCLALIPPALAPNPLLLWLSLALLGAGNSAMDVSMNAQAAAVEALSGRPIMSSFHGLWSVGNIVGAGYASLMAWLNITPLFHFISVTILICVAELIASHWLLPVARPTDRNAPIFARPTGALLGLGIMGFCSFLCEGAIADWGGVYLHSSLGTDTALAALGYACYSLAMTIARLNGDSLTLRIGPVWQARLGGLVALSGWALALLVPYPLAAIIGFVCVGAGVACVAPLIFSTASRIPGVAPGLGLAAVATLSYTGSLAGPPVIGQLARFFSLREALVLMVLLCATIVLLASGLRQPAVADSQPDERIEEHLVK